MLSRLQASRATFVLCLPLFAFQTIDATSADRVPVVLNGPVAMSPVPTLGGYSVEVLETRRTIDMLASHPDSAKVVESLLRNGTDPDAVHFLAFASVPEGVPVVETSGVPAPADGLAALSRHINELLDGTDLETAGGELLLGVHVGSDGRTESLQLFFVRTASGERRLFVGQHEFELAPGGPVAHEQFEGTWLEEQLPSGTSMEKGLFKKLKQAVKAVKNYGACIQSCLAAVGVVLAASEVTCVVAVILGCIPSGPGYALCVTGGVVFCVSATFLTFITFCAIHCG